VILGLWGGFRRRIVTSLVGTFGVGLGLLAVGLAPATAFWLALAGVLLVGLMVPVYSGPKLAIYQSCVPSEMQGRFFTLNDSLLQVMAPLGLSISGPLSDTFGVRAWIVLAGIACVVIAFVRVLIPSVLYIENRTHTEDCSWS
jgi:DHA3 family macrolide efflux protein-like MFS transporter